VLSGSAADTPIHNQAAHPIGCAALIFVAVIIFAGVSGTSVNGVESATGVSGMGVNGVEGANGGAEWVPTALRVPTRTRNA